MDRVFLSDYIDDYKSINRGQITEQRLAHIMLEGHNREPLFDLNVDDYILTNNGNIGHITNLFVESYGYGFGSSRKGFISDVIEYDNMTDSIIYTVGYDITDQVYKHNIINYPKINEIIPKSSKVKYLFSLMDEIFDCYLRLLVTGTKHSYAYSIDSDTFDALTITKAEWSEFLKNKEYDNCMDYIISKDSSRLDKLCNIANKLYDFISDKMLSSVRIKSINTDDIFFIPRGIDKYNIVFDLVRRGVKKSKYLDTVLVYVGDLLNQDFEIVDYNKEYYKKYKECIYNNAEKIFYLYSNITNKSV